MNNENISQIPVIENNTICGVVTERKILRPVYNGEISMSDSINLVSDTRFKVIYQEELLTQVTEKLDERETVIVTKDNKPFSILTHIDILQYISQSGNY